MVSDCIKIIGGDICWLCYSEVVATVMLQVRVIKRSCNVVYVLDVQCVVSSIYMRECG
jgi:hypothetical protein